MNDETTSMESSKQIIEELMRACVAGIYWLDQVSQAQLGSATLGMLTADIATCASAVKKARKHLEQPEAQHTGALSVTVGDGKYTVQQDAAGRLTALRYGEPWRDCCGDGLIYTLAAEVETLREQLARATHSKELEAKAEALVQMVFDEQSAPWVNKSGGLLIDTQEWCAFHVRLCEIQAFASKQLD